MPETVNILVKKKLDKNTTLSLLMMGMSYRTVAAQSGYSLPTICSWANEPNIKEKLQKARSANKKRNIKDNLPAFMHMLSNKHRLIYLELFNNYTLFVSAQKKPEAVANRNYRDMVIDMLMAGETQRAIAAQFGMSTATVNKIAKQVKTNSVYRKKQKTLFKTCSYSLSIFMVWLKKHDQDNYELVQTIYNKYIH